MTHLTRRFLAILMVFLLIETEEYSAIITQKEYKTDLLFPYQVSKNFLNFLL